MNVENCVNPKGHVEMKKSVSQVKLKERRIHEYKGSLLENKYIMINERIKDQDFTKTNFSP